MTPSDILIPLSEFISILHIVDCKGSAGCCVVVIQVGVSSF